MKTLSKEERAQLVHNAEQGVSPPPEDVQRYEATVNAAEQALVISLAIQDKQATTIRRLRAPHPRTVQLQMEINVQRMREAAERKASKESCGG